MTKLLSHKKVKVNEDKKEGPEQFTYVEQDGLLMVGSGEYAEGRWKSTWSACWEGMGQAS